MKFYYVNLQHDRGVVKIKVWAQNKVAAINSVLVSEGCPLSAIKSVKPVKKGGWK